MHAFRDASLEMLGRAEEKVILGGLLNIKVLKPEDLIGLKLQAIKNDAEQKHNPFFKNGKAHADAYIEFVTQYNDFINHLPKPFRRMIDNDMKL